MHVINKKHSEFLYRMLPKQPAFVWNKARRVVAITKLTRHHAHCMRRRWNSGTHLPWGCNTSVLAKVDPGFCQLWKMLLHPLVNASLLIARQRAFLCRISFGNFIQLTGEEYWNYRVKWYTINGIEIKYFEKCFSYPLHGLKYNIQLNQIILNTIADKTLREQN